MLRFAPDAQEITPEVLTAVSAVPTVRGYRNPLERVDAGFSALASGALGGALVYKLDGSSRTIVGTVDALYEASGSSWTDVSGSTYASGANKWQFAQFGDTTLAVNKATQLQYSSSGAFADVTNAPKAACMETVGRFVVLGNCDDTSTGLATGYGDQPDRWWTSPSFAATGDWTPSVSTGATSGLLVATPGAITGMRRLGGAIVAYKARSVYLGVLVDGPEAIRWDVVADDVGCASANAIVPVGSAHYFVGDNDFYVFDGTRPRPIGADVREWFFSRVNRSYLANIESLHDRANNNVYWFYPLSQDVGAGGGGGDLGGGEAGTLSAVVVYNYATGRWGAYEDEITCALQAVTTGITYDDLGTLFATYDDLPAIGYDSPYWIAGEPVLAVVSTDDVLYTLTGTTGPGSVTTGWLGAEESVALCSRVRPRFRVFPATAQMAHDTCMWQGGTISANAATDINADRFDTLQTARYHRFTLSFTGAFEIEAIGARLQPVGAE